MKHRYLLFCLIIALSGCKRETQGLTIKDYRLIEEEGIYVEQFDTTVTDDNRYTRNNLTYKEGNTLIYDYYYEDLTGKRYKFAELEGASDMDFREREKAWNFVPLDSLTNETIDKIILTVKPGREPMSRNNPDYNQTVIGYQFPQVDGKKNFSSATGAIDNERNVWLHPPRARMFQILELNPFPFIQDPYEKGNKWAWELQIGSFWGDERWKVWEGSIVNHYEYEITGNKILKTPLGNLECIEVKATATSNIGKTGLTAYYHPEIGFVKLDYTNIDGTGLNMSLSDFTLGTSQ